MGNYNKRPVKGVMTPPTEEEKRMQVMRFLSQKREQFSVNILIGLCSNPAAVGRKSVVSGDGSYTEIVEINNRGLLVSKAVEMADELLERLYPLKDEGKGEEVREAAEE